ncbi:uncharacterized protein JCM6883_001248 [Sporobolomyces salmoneus]|uniref:uncharacterized protein n=1 Tax=Sporobolomyces salmoneus TaxID=183962 RepID=UPI00317E3D0F
MLSLIDPEQLPPLPPPHSFVRLNVQATGFLVFSVAVHRQEGSYSSRMSSHHVWGIWLTLSEADKAVYVSYADTLNSRPSSSSSSSSSSSTSH